MFLLNQYTSLNIIRFIKFDQRRFASTKDFSIRYAAAKGRMFYSILTIRFSPLVKKLVNILGYEGMLVIVPSLRFCPKQHKLCFEVRQTIRIPT